MAFSDEVAQMAALGWPPSEIADCLECSEQSVRETLAKLGLLAEPKPEADPFAGLEWLGI